MHEHVSPLLLPTERRRNLVEKHRDLRNVVLAGAKFPSAVHADDA